MGVYIKGMEMPKSCYKCPLRWREGMDIVCPVAHARFFVADVNILEYRLKNCPLVPVPKHGRCIDADALVDKHFGKEFLSKVMTADEDDLGTDLVNVPLVINNAPTILEAEEE